MGVDFFFPQADAKEFQLKIECSFCGDTVYDYLRGEFTDDTAKMWDQRKMLTVGAMCDECKNKLIGKWLEQ